MSRSKKKRYLNKRFHYECVQVIKKHSGGYIHPDDTSWEGLAFGFECLHKIEHTSTDRFTRCVELARPFIAARKIPLLAEVTSLVDKDIRRNFYASYAWKRLRYKVLQKYGARCQCCGADNSTTVICVDHIKPISKYWHLRLDEDNVQVLCRECNWGKLNTDETDWR